MDTRTETVTDPATSPHADEAAADATERTARTARNASPGRADAAGADASASPLLDAADVLLVYDGECPACDNYCRVVRIREDVGRLVIVDAREDTPIMREITAAGLDIDEGMVLKLGERLYYGQATRSTCSR